MKTKFSLLVLSLVAFSSFGQLTFNVSPGLNLNSASIGYKIKKLEPYLGFQHLGARLKYETQGQEFDSGNNLVDFTDTYEVKVNLYLPTIGLKYYVIEKGSIQGYLNANFTYVIASGKVLNNGVEDDYYIKETVNNANLFGIELGYGMEYFFDEHFSLGGEFGIRIIQGRTENSYEANLYNPGTMTYQYSTFTNSFKGTVTPTYTKIGLKFYF